MTIPVLIILGALWAAVLVPPLLRARSDRRTGAIGDYAHTLGVLKTSTHSLKTVGRPTAALVDGAAHNRNVHKSTAIKKRRRDIFTGMLCACGITFLLALLASSPLIWFIHIACDIALGAYVYLLIQIKEQEKLKAQTRTYSRHPQRG